MSLAKTQVEIAEANDTLPTLGSATTTAAASNSFVGQFRSIWQKEAVARPTIPQAAYLFDLADPDIQAALTGTMDAHQALNTIANAWNRLGAGNAISQSAPTPGASRTACP